MEFLNDRLKEVNNIRKMTGELKCMFIKYKESDLMEFFGDEPILIGDIEAEESMYIEKQGDFKIILLLSAYEKCVQISITYQEKIVYSEEYQDILEIKKIDHNTLKVISEKQDIIIVNKPQIGVYVEK